MTETRSFTAPQGRPRLDAFLGAQAPDLSRSYAKKLIADGMVTVNGTEAKPAYALRGGDVVSVVIPDPERLDLTPEPIPLAVVYEDADLIVVDKSAGMTVHPAPGHPHGTLVHALLAHCPDLAGIGGVERPGIVHRLDKDTSGLIAAAKNGAAHRSLTGQFKARTVSKMYLALVKGRPRQSEGRIDAPLGRDPRHRKRIAPVDGGREAVTGYRTAAAFEGATLLEVRPLTGRTHQIRAHFASIGHPLVGDALYGGKSALLARHFLHASSLEIDHPRTGRRLALESPLPPDLTAALGALTPLTPEKKRSYNAR